MFKRIAAWYRRGQRSIDMTTLWPACKRKAKERGFGMNEAKAAFACHAFYDLAWRKDYSHNELVEYIDNLE